MIDLLQLVIIVIVIAFIIWFFFGTSTEAFNTIPGLYVNLDTRDYYPIILRVQTGNLVIFRNADNKAMTISGDALNSHTLAPGQIFTYRYSNPGLYEFNFAGKHGRISVSGPDYLLPRRYYNNVRPVFSDYYGYHNSEPSNW